MPPEPELERELPLDETSEAVRPMDGGMARLERLDDTRGVVTAKLVAGQARGLAPPKALRARIAPHAR